MIKIFDVDERDEMYDDNIVWRGGRMWRNGWMVNENALGVYAAVEVLNGEELTLREDAISSKQKQYC